MLDAINAIVSFINMIINFVVQFVTYAGTMFKFLFRAFTVCFTVLSYIPAPFAQFAYLTFICVIIFVVLRIIHG